MADVALSGRIIRWGNGLAFRIAPGDAAAAGLAAGQEVTVRIDAPPAPTVDLAAFPIFESGVTDTAARHDHYLAAAAHRPRVEAEAGEA